MLNMDGLELKPENFICADTLGLTPVLMVTVKPRKKISSRRAGRRQRLCGETFYGGAGRKLNKIFEKLSM